MANVPMIQVADDVKNVAESLIPKYHPHLTDAKILYLFTDQTRKNCNKIKAGSAAKMGHMARFLASALQSVESGPDFVLIFGSNEWMFMDAKQQYALVDHELTHCAVYIKDGTDWRILKETESKDDFPEWKWDMRGHDIEEFSSIVGRYGFWRNDHDEQKFAESVKQLSLPGLAIMAQSVN